MEPNYTIVYSKRKTLNITVERDRSVVVRAPEGTDSQKIRHAVESKRLWIYEKIRHPQKYRGIPRPPGAHKANDWLQEHGAILEESF
jgi:predicted metal-dependent hydrolase